MRHLYIKLTDDIKDEEGQTIKHLLHNTDLDLELYYALGGTLAFDEEYCWIECPDPGALGDLGDLYREISLLTGIGRLALDQEHHHMRLYDQYGKYHDGGDDFDYGGTYLLSLADLLLEHTDKTELR